MKIYLPQYIRNFVIVSQTAQKTITECEQIDTNFIYKFILLTFKESLLNSTSVIIFYNYIALYVCYKWK